MDILLAIIVGLLYTSGAYLMLSRSFVKLIIGLIMMGNATNLFLFTISRLTRGKPALIPKDATEMTGPFADPLPQALILTAIVISFGIQAFAIVLLKRVYARLKTSDLDNLNTTDKIDEA